MSIRRSTRTAVFLAMALAASSRAQAHCDTMDGPVVKEAMAALAARDVTPLLKWVAPGKEDEIRARFAEAVRVRALGRQAQELADRAFVETLVRIHREGEGAPYTGLKPVGGEVHRAATAADRALEKESPDALVEMVTADVERGLRERFARAAAARAHAGESVAKGREYVAAYVEFVHYAERVDAGAGEAAGGDAHEHRSARAVSTPGDDR